MTQKHDFLDANELKGRLNELSDENLKKLHFEVLKIKPNQIHNIGTECEELVCVLSKGHIRVSFQKGSTNLYRQDPFESLPSAVYLPPFSTLNIENIGNETSRFYLIRVAIPKDSQLVEKPILIKPENIKTFSRGKETYYRTIRNIIDKDFPAHTLLCGETINPPGHWSSFPPHKHDSSLSDDESEHEEVYFHLFSPSGGWGYQEIYSPERDERKLIRIKNEDIVSIPYGYHPVVSAPGYSLCYFWALAGESRELKMKEDEKHSWIQHGREFSSEIYSTIISQLPHPKSIELLKKLEDSEPASMLGQPPVIWDRAQGFQVFDPYGNVFIDFSSGVLIANTGHNHPKVNRAILNQVGKGLLSSYLFPNMNRLGFVEALKRHVPFSDAAVLLLSTGSEAIESCIKIVKTYGKLNHSNKKVIVSFVNAFHGRTMGAQLAGGVAELKKWIEPLDTSFIQVPFPDGVYSHDLEFSSFEQSLEKQNISPNDVCAVLMEPYQGGTVSFAPKPYILTAV